ncbi:MAG: hypothetical protein JXB48_03275 [Candidatus Latescibacteria bacterium]|nr:hypothetical protein [Candidatus Latescibacterota bacterium]
MPKFNNHIKRMPFFLILYIAYTAAILNFKILQAQQSWQDWLYRMPITLTNRSGDNSDAVPVDVTFSLYADQCRSPEKEIRLVLKTSNGEKEVPFQLSDLSIWTKDTGERSSPTLNGMITFFDEAPGNGDAEYALLYGNPNVSAPVYPTDLKVSGTKPSWTIENSKIALKLHGRNPAYGASTNKDSGQISSVIIKAKPNAPIAPGTGVIHWNPGIFVPARGWMHSFAWDPPEQCDIETGPLYVNVTRSGIFPDIPEVHLSINYRIFTGRNYVESGTVMRVNDNIGVVALRNNQLVFDAGTFTHIAWGRSESHEFKNLDVYKQVNTHGDILRLRDDLDYITFVNPSKGIGTASVKIDYSNVGPGGAPPTLFDNATYVSNGGHDLMYFFRPLVYFHIDWDRKQLVTVPKGSVYSERNLYVFYESQEAQPIQAVLELNKAVQTQPVIKIGPYGFPPMK